MNFRIEVRLDSPTAISERRAMGNVYQTVDRIPGRGLRGALAAAYLNHGGSAADPEFVNLFLDSNSRFSDCLPGRSETAPLSLRLCREKGEEGEHQPIDLLLMRGTGGREPAECEVGACGAKLGTVSGNIEWQRNGGYWEARRAKTRQVAHVEIDRESGKARSGQFHTAEILEPGQRFRGTIRAKPEVENAIRALAAGPVWLGRGQTRGQGRARVAILEKKEMEDAKALTRRLVEFQREAEALEFYRGKAVFAVKLESAAMLLDQWLRPRAGMTGADLDSSLVRYRLLGHFAGMRRQGGWHQKAQLPRPDEWVVQAGSVYLFGVDTADAAGALGEATEGLARAQERGVGEKLREGFGEISIASRVFWQRAYRGREEEGR